MEQAIPYQNIRYFSSLIKKYLSEDIALSDFYNHFPNLENFSKQIAEKKGNFPKENRAVLTDVLKNQYKNTDNDLIISNIESIGNENTFCVTTGHQLSLFTGPLYFVYKIVSTIKLCQILSVQFPDFQFVPIYWMASEDHDFEEINHFFFKGKKLHWQSEETGAVGRFSTKSLDGILALIKSEFGVGKASKYLVELFENAYLKHKTLKESTFYLVNALFGKYGLLCLDADTPSLKKVFVPYLKSEILRQNSFEQVTKYTKRLENLHFSAQVHPRQVNLFYMKDHFRERIIKTETGFAVHNTDIHFSKENILIQIERHPEYFSPNVIMRPLYQEVILPNLCYVGGGGEIAYWLQLKSLFDTEKVTFPMLLLRNSVLLISKKQVERLKKLQLSVQDLFQTDTDLANDVVERFSSIKIDFTPQKEHLKKQFEVLYEMAERTDKSFYNAVKSQEMKQLKGISFLEKRLLKAQKRVLADKISRAENLRQELFPQGGLQERVCNFSEFFIQEANFIDLLVQKLDPLSGKFTVIELS